MSAPYAYQPYWCEENVWHLCRREELSARKRQVVFISNERKMCPMWAQRACPSEAEPVLWDYHVVLLVRSEDWRVWDLDHRYGLDVPLRVWLLRSFAPRGALPEELEPRFRVVEADLLLEAFSSDRSHMRAEDGSFRAPPPPWPPIHDPARGMNLPRFIDTTTPFLGEVLDRDALARRFLEEPG